PIGAARWPKSGAQRGELLPLLLQGVAIRRGFPPTLLDCGRRGTLEQRFRELTQEPVALGLAVGGLGANRLGVVHRAVEVRYLLPDSGITHLGGERLRAQTPLTGPHPAAEAAIADKAPAVRAQARSMACRRGEHDNDFAAYPLPPRRPAGLEVIRRGR